ncbi:MAG: electron transfer flavoprotein subunit beta/FixA family protein [Alphaproteobacteria bacterium]|jgi:electron transfer flavoprotein beta subunit
MSKLNILVPIKRVIDYNVKIRVKDDLSGVVTDNVKMSPNPFDEIALEEALRLKEKGFADAITAITIGEKKCEDVLRQALAMGADFAIHVLYDKPLFSLQAAKILKKIIEAKNFNLVITGKQAIDDDANQTGQILAGILNWPQATFASKVQVEGETLQVTREVDGGLETLSLAIPAVITTDLRLNTPRYVALPNIIKARSKPIEVINPETLQISLNSHLKILKTEAPVKRKAGIKVKSVDELITILKQVI